jgi:hypothetical protein
MGISNVAVKTFDSTGSQSLCRTNEYKGDEEVKSSFISKCNKLYISGTGETVIPGTLRSFPTTKSTDVFYINSDTDSISDMTLNVEFKLKRPSDTTGTWNANVSKDIILGLIDKVEIKVGSLTVQSLTADDIYIRNLTELGQAFTFSAPFENELEHTALSTTTTEIHPPIGNRNVWKYIAAGENDVIVIQAACSIPFIGRSNDMSRSLLQAGSLTNAVTVKVYYNNIYTDNSTNNGSYYQILSAGDGNSSTGTSGNFLDKTYFKSHVKVRTHIITETEKNFISKNVINKVLNTSSNVTKEIPKTSINTLEEGVIEVEVDLEDISLNVSHLLIGVRLPHVKDQTLNFNLPSSTPNVINLAEVTGNNELSTPFTVINSQTFNVPGGNAPNPPGNLFGYMPNAIESMELVLGSDRTGFIKGASAKIGTCENFTLVNSDKNSAHYIVPLAEKAFDTSGVAFSKNNNKKLLINLNKYIFKITDVTPNSLSNSGLTTKAIISVTACGTKVQSVVGGSMSFM